jgi:hypothetical protein
LSKGDVISEDSMNFAMPMLVIIGVCIILVHRFSFNF